MSVKSSQSGARMLTVFEAIAARQPVGASALARHLDEDKSAVQRSLVTLANAGWICATGERPTRWELSPRLFTLANLPQSSEDLRRQARPMLESLREATGETAFLAIPDGDRFVVIDSVESHHMLRISPRIGQLITSSRSATSRAFLAHFDNERQQRLLQRQPTEKEIVELAATRQRGYGVSQEEVVPGSTNISAPILDFLGLPQAAIAITGPSERLGDRIESLGELLKESAAGLSRRKPAFADM